MRFETLSMSNRLNFISFDPLNFLRFYSRSVESQLFVSLNFWRIYNFFNLFFYIVLFPFRIDFFLFKSEKCVIHYENTRIFNDDFFSTEKPFPVRN